MGSDCSFGAHVVTINVEESKRLLESGYYYVDVRTEEEYGKGHLNVDKITNVPYMFNTPQGRVKNPAFLNEVSKLFKDDDNIIVGCQSGARSASATAVLTSHGFKKVMNMDGGYAAWLENKFPVLPAYLDLRQEL